MDDIKKLYDRLVDLWAVLLGMVGGITAIWRVYRVYGTRIWRAILLSDAIHDHFGAETANKFIAEIRDRKRDGVVRESRLQLVEKKLDLAVYLCSAEGQCQWVNNEFGELFGIERVYCIGHGWLEGIEAIERGQVYDVWMHAVKNKLPYEYRYTIKNRRTGVKMKCVTYAFPHLTSDGEVLCYVGYVQSEEKQ